MVSMWKLHGVRVQPPNNKEGTHAEYTHTNINYIFTRIPPVWVSEQQAGV